MPSEPSFGVADGAVAAVVEAVERVVASGVSFPKFSGATFSRNVAEGTKNRLPVTARLKSRSRS